MSLNDITFHAPEVGTILNLLIGRNISNFTRAELLRKFFFYPSLEHIDNIDESLLESICSISLETAHWP